MILKLFLPLFSLSLLVSSCTSVSRDAQKAASLRKESIDHTRNYELEKAEESFNRSQEIINQYKDSRDYRKFSEEYAEAMQG